MGYFRFAFSILIMIAHLADKWGILANLSVLGFYVLAGYLAAASTGKDRPIQYLCSRFIRLWPSYFAVMLATLITLQFTSLHAAGMPDRIGLFLQYLMVVPSWPHAAVVPQAWLLKWFLLGYGVSVFLKTSKAAFYFLMLTLAWSHLTAFTVENWWYHYISPSLAMLCFAIGSMGHWAGVTIPRDKPLAGALGALSYPVFLSHHWIGATISAVLGIPLGWPLFWASLGPTLAVSVLLWRFVEVPVDRFRKTFRNHKETP